MVAPRWTIGPSRPALAPDPSDSTLAMALEQTLLKSRPRPAFARASMTSGTASVRLAVGG